MEKRPTRRKNISMEDQKAQEIDQIAEKVIGAAIEVHRALGPGLLESAYEECLSMELEALGLKVQRQVPLPVSYKGKTLECGYRLDMVVEASIILELKSIDRIDGIHVAQLLTYLKLSGLRVGYLINFNVSMLKNGIKRVVNG
jgi:GxxExxY protein